MRVVLRLNVDDRERYVIAKALRETGSRATRKQVRYFAEAALRATARRHADALTRRQRAAAERAAEDREAPEPVVPEPSEIQLELWDETAGGGV